MTDDELREWRQSLLYGSRVGVCLNGVVKFGTLRDYVGTWPDGTRNWMIVWDLRHPDPDGVYGGDIWNRPSVPLPSPGETGWIPVEKPKKPRRSRRETRKRPAGQPTA